MATIKELDTKDNNLQKKETNGEWFITDKFFGLETKKDPSKITDGASSFGYNTSVNGGDKISARPFGLQSFPESVVISVAELGESLHTFRKRSGENILIKVVGGKIKYYETGTGKWETLSSSYTPGSSYDWSDYNLNTDLSSYTYFGNAVDPFSRWSGAHTTVLSVTANTITKTGSDTWQAIEFKSSGTVVIKGVTYTYTGGYNTGTLTGVTPDPSAGGVVLGDAVAQSIDQYPSLPRGNIYLATSNRLFISGVKTAPQAVYFSKYGDTTDFTSSALVTGSTATSSGTFNLTESGGGVTDMTMDESAIYMWKKNIVYKAVLTDTMYSISCLKPYDGKSQTMGAAYKGSVFTGGNSTFLPTPDGQFLSLQRVEQVDYPQELAISDIIKPTVKSLAFDSTSGISFNDQAFAAVQSSTNVNGNDTVLIWNIAEKTWENLLTGWNVKEWAIYDDGNGDKLYFLANNSDAVFLVTNTPTDNDYDVLALWRSKQYSFYLGSKQKILHNVFVEGHIAENASIIIKLYLNEGGVLKTYEATIDGTDDTITFSNSSFNSFGENPFGMEMFGSNDDLSGLKKFRVYFKDELREIPFYNAQIEFSSDGANQQWDVIAYGFKVKEYYQEEDRKLYKAFK